MSVDSFAAWLHAARRARDLTQSELAERVGCSTELISKIERGSRRPSRQLALLLAEQLGAPADQREALADLARGSPPPRPAPPAPAELAAPPLAPLLGREAELARLAALFADPDVRLVTLAGPGGIGKTQLALAYAAQLPPPLSPVVVPLGATAAAADVAPAIARALGLDMGGPGDPLSLVIAALAGRPALLLLDNLEQLLEAPGGGEPFAALIEALLAGCPELRILATSRERLQLRAEWLLPLDGLAVGAGEAPAAAELLFLQTMGRLRPPAELSAAERRAVGQICRTLDGHPLAIELAATWTRTLSPQEIARELMRSLELLTSQLRDTPARHRSMAAVFEQSWALLSQEQRATLARLALFRAAFGREAAAYVARADLRLLGALVQRSLVRRAGAGYELHPLIRHDALQRLRAEPGYAEATRRYVDYHLAYAIEAEAGLSGGEQLRWLDQIGQELDNLREALRLSLADEALRESGARIGSALRRYWALRGPYREGLGWAERLLAAGPLRPELRASLLSVVGALASPLGEAERAIAAGAEAVELRRQSGEPEALAAALRILASAEGAHGRPAQAREHLEEALRLWEGQGNQHEAVVTYGALAQLAWDERDLDAARRRYGQAAELARRAGYQIELAALLVNAGLIALAQGDPAGAASCAEALVLAESTGEQLVAAYALEALAAHAGAAGDPAGGGALIGAAEALRARLQAPVDSSYRPIYERFLQLARGALDPAAFAAAVAAGRALPLAEASARARAAERGPSPS